MSGRPTLVVIAIVLTAIAAWAGVRVAQQRIASHAPEPPPPALFDEARDLPARPPPADDGWIELTSVPAATFDETPFPSPELFAPPGDGLPPLEATVAARDAIHAWSVDDDAVALLDRALARPAFAFACPVDLEIECPVVPTVRAMRVAMGLALRDVLDGDDARGLLRTTRIVVAARGLLDSARSLLEGASAEMVATAAIELVALVGVLIGARTTPPPAEVAPAIDALDLALRALDPSSWTLEPSLVGEAIRTRRELARAPSETPGIADEMRDSDATFEAAIAYAHDPAHAPRPLARHAGSPDETGIDVAPIVDRFLQRAATSVDRADVARVALTAARARAAGPR